MRSSFARSWWRDRWVPELFHQWRSELLEGVAEQNHLVVVAQPVEKLAGSVERSHVGEHRPQIAIVTLLDRRISSR